MIAATSGSGAVFIASRYSGYMVCSAAARGCERHLLAIRKLGEELVVARQMIGHRASGPRHFHHCLAGIGSDLLARVVKKIGGPNERLRQIIRIVDDHHHGQDGRHAGTNVR